MRFIRAVLPVACLAVAISPGIGKERFRLEGLLDTEFWDTDGESRFLGVNEDEPATLGRLRLWAAGEFTSGLQGFALAQVEGGEGTDEGETETEIEQAFVRYSFQRHRLMIEGGKLATPIGNFSRRYFSSQNPLIGAPAGYSVGYPAGLVLSGAAGSFDYKIALIDKPVVNERWTPEADSDLRPALATGMTPIVGTRIGVFATSGTYLGEEVEDFLMPGESWKDYDQLLYGLDFQFSRGYFELNAELSRSIYEVPLMSDLRGIAYFVEPKYTFTPRLFAAMRYERNDYAYIQPVSSYYWLGTTADFSAVELGIGYRAIPGMIVKTAYRRDWWHEEDRSFFPDGHSFAVQLSYQFDVNSWFRRPL